MPIQPVDRHRISTHGIEQPTQVEGYHPDILCRAALDEIIAAISRAEVGNKIPVRISRNNITVMEEIPPILRTPAIQSSFFDVPQSPGERRDREIVCGVFQSKRR